jgi:hypothetical protein
MTNSSRFLFLISFAIILCSCEYKPTEKYHVSLEKPIDAPPINVDLKLMTDTINFYWSSTLNMIINPGNLRVLNVKYYVNNVEISGSQNENTYSVLLNFTQPGTYKFKFSIITSSGSNSLADKLNAEGFQYDSKEWTLVGKALNYQNNLNWQITNGSIQFSWKKYDGPDFKKYRLKELANGVTADLETTTYLNTAYVGEGGEIRVYVVDVDNKEHLWGSCILNKMLPGLSIGNINNKVGLIWNQSFFKDKIAEYQVFQRDNSAIWTKIATLPVSDTALIIPIANTTFAPYMSFYLYCIPKSYTSISNPSDFTSYLLNVYVALHGPDFLNNYGLNSSGFYFDSYSQTLKKTILYKYSYGEDKVTTVMDNVWYKDISPNANFMTIPHDSILDLYDTNTNTIIKSTNFKSLANYYNSIGSPKISDNGICIFNANNVLYAFNLLTNTLIASKNMSSSLLRISADGKYFAVSKIDSLLIYQINSNSISFRLGLKKAGGYIFSYDYNFCPDVPDQLYLFDNPKLIVWSCDNLSIVRSFNISQYFYNIDFHAQKVLTARNASIWDIYDYKTGNLVQSISGLGGNTNYSLLLNNTLFISGYKFYLNN